MASARVFNEVPAWSAPVPAEGRKPGCLDLDQLEHFYREGFLIVRDFFREEELSAGLRAIERMVDDLAQKLFRAGKIQKLYEEFGVFQRLTELDRAWPGATILLFKSGKLPKAFMEIWSNERMLNVAEQFLGDKVAGHPVWNLRVKTPHNDFGTVPWHQDSAYFSQESYDHMILTAWIPFLDTNAQNGGMQVVKGAHRKGKVAKHTCCTGPTWYVDLDEEEMKDDLGCDLSRDVVTCDVPFGGFLLFHNLTPHRSLPNMSNNIRWSIDLRWQSPTHHWGFYDIVDGILFRDPEKPLLEPDWDKFLSVNRKEIWQKKYFKRDKIGREDEFDLTVTGPWIGRWEIVNHNKHTKSFSANIR